MPVLSNSGPSGVEEEFGNSDLTHAGEQLEKPWVWLPTSTDEVLADLRDTGSYPWIPGLFPPKIQFCQDTAQEHILKGSSGTLRNGQIGNLASTSLFSPGPDREREG